MRRAGGVAIAAVAAALCLTVLGGCRGHADGSQSVGNAPTTASTGTAPAGAANVSGGGSGTAAPADAGVDSDLDTVDGQLSGLDSALAQATASPSDGG